MANQSRTIDMAIASSDCKDSHVTWKDGEAPATTTIDRRTDAGVRKPETKKKRLSNYVASHNLEASIDDVDAACPAKRIRSDDGDVSSVTFAYYVDSANDESVCSKGNESGHSERLLGAFSRPADENIPFDLTPRGAVIAKADVNDLSAVFSNSGRTVFTLYLFPTCIEVVKKSRHAVQGTNSGLIMLPAIRSVINVNGLGEKIPMFCLTVRHNIFGDNSCAFLFRGSVNDGKENSALSLSEDKKAFLTKLSNCITKATGRTAVYYNYEGSLPDDGELGLVVAKALKRVETEERPFRSVRRSTSRLVRQVVDNVVSISRSNSLRTSFRKAKRGNEDNHQAVQTRDNSGTTRFYSPSSGPTF